MTVVLITGTSKGLGLELAKYYLDSGATVIGISRSQPPIHHAKYHHCTADIMLESSVAVLEQFVESLGVANINLVINNAGSGSYGNHLSDSEPKEVLDQVNLHCVGALRVTKAAQGFIGSSKIVNVTSRLGSIYQNERGDFSGKNYSYGYRIAKCAQNMLSLCMADDPELASAIILSVNPGLLRTDSGSEDAEKSAVEGANKLVSVITAASTSGIYHAFGDEACY
jgi:NAD(P)-dependent dehydrogenase (short-subunit alcohol dehydrogenase family)